MARLNTRKARAARAVTRGPLATAGVVPDGRTHQGGAGFSRDAQTQLFLLATTTFVGEDTYYESASAVAERVRQLTREIALTQDGWLWLKEFTPWLRSGGNIRTAAIVIALEAVKARLDDRNGNLTQHHANDELGSRQLVAAVLQRADEPGEALAYWLGRYGRRIPKPVKRGIADAAGRLYTERNFLRYDSDAKAFRMADVLELTRPRGRNTAAGLKALHANPDRIADRTWQDELYRWIITSRHDREGAEPSRHLPSVRARWDLSRLAPADRHGLARQALIAGAIFADEAFMASPLTVLENAMAGQWEWLHSWLGDQTGVARCEALSKADQWRLALPRMGYMALLRNLRNLDQAGLDDATLDAQVARLMDPDQVAHSRQLPFRFWTAYREAPSLRWGHALERALTLSLGNVPILRGRSLVLIDTSDSMGMALSDKGTVSRLEAAAMFGLALALKSPGEVDVFGFADDQFAMEMPPGGSLLRAVDEVNKQRGRVGYGTQIGHAVMSTFQPGRHDRVFIFTDMQTMREGGAWGGGVGYLSVQHGPAGNIADAIPDDVPVYGFNVTGYSHSAMPVGHGLNRHELGGLTDATFRIVAALEAGRDGHWPWQA